MSHIYQLERVICGRAPAVSAWTKSWWPDLRVVSSLDSAEPPEARTCCAPRRTHHRRAKLTCTSPCAASALRHARAVVEGAGGAW
eukprot:1442366-Prymnesium_polylepis.2